MELIINMQTAFFSTSIGLKKSTSDKAISHGTRAKLKILNFQMGEVIPIYSLNPSQTLAFCDVVTSNALPRPIPETLIKWFHSSFGTRGVTVFL